MVDQNIKVLGRTDKQQRFFQLSFKSCRIYHQMHSRPDSHSELTYLASLSTASFSLRHLSSSRLWDVCLLRSAVWYLQYDDANGDCGGPVRGDHQASCLPGHDVSQESPEHCGCCLGLLNGLEHAPLLWLEWVWPGNWVVIDQCDSSQGFSLWAMS